MSRQARPARRRLSMTPLVDVIFLLLLFFMLSSTFSRFAEVELGSAVARSRTDGGAKPMFLQLGVTEMALNGAPVAVDTLADSFAPQTGDTPPQPVLISLAAGVTAQRLTDLLVALRAIPQARAVVLGG